MNTILKFWCIITFISLLLLDKDNSIHFNILIGLNLLAYILVFLNKLKEDEKIYLKNKNDIF